MTIDYTRALLEEVPHERTLELTPLTSWEEVEASRQAYADALGRSVATLTETEKQTAFLNHVFEKLDQPLKGDDDD